MYNSPNFFIKNTLLLLITPFPLPFKNDFPVGDRNRNLLGKIETERIGGGGVQCMYISLSFTTYHFTDILERFFCKLEI